jgi:hypothetical protein
MTRSLIPLAFACAALLASAGAYAWCYRTAAKESAVSAALSTRILEQSQEATRVKAAKEALASLATDESSVNQYFVKESDIVPFLGSLEKTGKDLGAAVEVASVSAEDGPGGRRIVLALKISGSFDSVLRTLGSIEYGPYMSGVQNLVLESVPGEGGSSLWEATGSFTIGSQKANAAP